jgi:hypothetical protein
MIIALIAVFAFIIGIMGVLLLFGWYLRSDDFKTMTHDWAVQKNNTNAIIQNPNVSCGQLIQLRIDNSQDRINLWSMGLLDNVRDLYNAKGCGNHWEFWER